MMIAPGQRLWDQRIYSLALCRGIPHGWCRTFCVRAPQVQSLAWALETAPAIPSTIYRMPGHASVIQPLHPVVSPVVHTQLYLQLECVFCQHKKKETITCGPSSSLVSRDAQNANRDMATWGCRNGDPTWPATNSIWAWLTTIASKPWPLG